jgi:hypothetical protein
MVERPSALETIIEKRGVSIAQSAIVRGPEDGRRSPQLARAEGHV